MFTCPGTDFKTTKKTGTRLAGKRRNAVGVRKLDASGRRSLSSAKEEMRGVHPSGSGPCKQQGLFSRPRATAKPQDERTCAG